MELEPQAANAKAPNSQTIFERILQMIPRRRLCALLLRPLPAALCVIDGVAVRARDTKRVGSVSRSMRSIRSRARRHEAQALNGAATRCGADGSGRVTPPRR